MLVYNVSFEFCLIDSDLFFSKTALSIQQFTWRFEQSLKSTIILRVERSLDKLYPLKTLFYHWNRSARGKNQEDH